MNKVLINVDYAGRNFCGSPADPGMACATVGRTVKELLDNMREAIALQVKGMEEDGLTVAEEYLGPYEFEMKMSTQALLKYIDGTISRTALSKVTGINVNQLTHYATGWRNPRPETQVKIASGVKTILSQLSSIVL